jgi:hypothetical protein
VADLERNHIGLGDNPALVVVDMIKGFTDPACPLGCDCPEVVAANQRLIQLFHRDNLSTKPTWMNSFATEGFVHWWLPG